MMTPAVTATCRFSRNQGRTSQRVRSAMWHGEENVREAWIEVLGYEDAYAVSHMGRVMPYVKSPAGIVMNLCLMSHKRHLGVDLLQKPCLIHELVALAFIGPRPESSDVNQLDDVTTHTCVTNREYSTRASNRAQVDEHRNLSSGAVRVGRWRWKLCGKDFRSIAEEAPIVQGLIDEEAFNMARTASCVPSIDGSSR
jgi:hypothetical protein